MQNVWADRDDIPDGVTYEDRTNVLVEYTRGNREAADYFDGLGDSWSTSMITCLELLAGARTQRETNDFDLLLSGYRAIYRTKIWLAVRRFGPLSACSASAACHGRSALTMVSRSLPRMDCF
jgi:hypothetical protein